MFVDRFAPSKSRCKSRARIAMLIAALSLCVACGDDENNAPNRKYDEAQALVDAGDLNQAVAVFEEIVQSYPQSEAAAKAREEIVLYRGLARAEVSYPMERARESVVLAARAIESFHGKTGRWPESLEQLVPDYLESEPRDPWDRLLVYEPKQRGRGYLLTCFGGDGAVGGRGVDADIYVDTGEFVAQPPRNF